MPRSSFSGNQNWRRWARIALGLSFLLHLLFLCLVELVYNPLALPESRYRVRLEPPNTFSFSEPFPSLAPSPLPVPSPHPGELEGLGQAPAPGIPGFPAGQGEGMAGQPGLPSGLPGGEFVPGKAPEFVVPALPIFDYDALLIDKMRQEIAEREQYARFHVLDADTTDDKSQRRSRARQIVERAIAVMGGREALGKIREMKARVWVEATEDVKEIKSGSVVVGLTVLELPPYVYPVVDWHFSSKGFERRPVVITTSFDLNTPNGKELVRDPKFTKLRFTRLYESRWSALPPQAGKLREQGEAARWHFIDHFLGEGVEIYYLTSEEFRNPYPHHEQDLEDRGKGRMVDVVQVVDERYGQLQEALFDQETGLLLALREGLTPAEQRWHMQRFGQASPVWMTLYGNYQPVQGVLTPHRLVRGSNLDPRFVAIHLKIAYNGEEPDRSEPDVRQ